MGLHTFELDDELYQKFKKISHHKDHESVKETLFKLINKYVQNKEPKSVGLELFMENPEALATPQFFADRHKWQKYLQSNEETFKKCEEQAKKILDYCDMTYSYNRNKKKRDEMYAQVFIKNDKPIPNYLKDTD